MPRVSTFFGITVSMYYGDHPPPHFHVRYGDDEAVLRIDDRGLLRGRLPVRAMSLVAEWAALHRDALVSNWERARLGKPLEPIPPLK